MTRSSRYITDFDQEFPYHLFASHILEGNVADSGKGANSGIVRK